MDRVSDVAAAGAATLDGEHFPIFRDPSPLPPQLLGSLLDDCLRIEVGEQLFAKVREEREAIGGGRGAPGIG